MIHIPEHILRQSNITVDTGHEPPTTMSVTTFDEVRSMANAAEARGEIARADHLRAWHRRKTVDEVRTLAAQYFHAARTLDDAADSLADCTWVADEVEQLVETALRALADMTTATQALMREALVTTLYDGKVRTGQ